jgi:hypothetical protein
MIKLLDILNEANNILIPRRSKEERAKNYNVIIQKKIQQYIKNGSKGDLDLTSSPLTSLPDNLTVGWDLILVDCPNLTSLPNNLTIGESIDLSGTPITRLPDDLKVGRSLTLDDTLIEQLPDNLVVRGSLNLGATPIKQLPNNLVVEEVLSLYNCENIKSLPSDLVVEDTLVLEGTPLAEKYTEEQIRKMAPGIKSSIILDSNYD